MDDDIYTQVRNSNAETAKLAGDQNPLWQVIDCMILNISTPFLESSRDYSPDRDLHELWHHFYLSAMNISPDHPNHDRLVVRILRARERGPLARYDHSRNELEFASTSDGAIVWTQLPYLVSDMTSLWIGNCPKMTAAQRVNFSDFLANLASLGVPDEGMCGIALALFRETLEMPRVLGEVGAHAQEDEGRSLGELTIGDLLPSALVWMKKAGRKILMLSEQGWGDCPEEVGGIGELLNGDFEEGERKAGFSAKRWWCWVRRLGEIVEEATKVQNEGVAKAATRMMDAMIVLPETLCTTIGEGSAVAGRFADWKYSFEDW